ncbi:radical SAM/SPASM domain-containing protein [Paenibacillus glacialis]|uniref:Radical SAM core domain-containing protein n=1 Tax=Paenibacillus glacialis TaxID=494026 RepID=A0A162KCW8_9BACL|nr:radical SAM protein [Paenibacillus glacialis]OAB44808.1 hypothetical protein PGLA_05190 [Paenibacillus glacialis]
MMVHIFVTNDCNLNCDYCYVASQREKKEFRVESISNLISFINRMLSLNKSEVVIFDFFGGEPLLNRECIEEIIVQAKERISVRQKYIMTTNGTLLTQKNVDYIISNNIDLSVSLDGHPNTHDKHRKFKSGMPSWNHISQNIEYLLKKIPHVTARMTFDSQTVSELYNNVKFLECEGFKIIKPIPDFFDENWSDENFEILKEQFKKLRLNSNPEIQVSLIKKRIFIQSDCSGGVDSFSINVNGDVYPCNYAVGNKDFCLGNISEFNKFELHSFHTDHSKRNECKGCAYFSSCESARCVFVNYKMTNNFHTPNGFFCSFERLISSVKTP